MTATVDTLSADGRILYGTPTPCTAPTPAAVTVATALSGNSKIGRIACTSRPQSTCPTTCPLMGSGCYGENRRPGGAPSLFAGFGAARKRAPLSVLALATRRYRKVPPAVRFNVVGDYLTPSGTPDHEYIRDTNTVATARPWAAWSYTHAWRMLRPDWFAYTVRASVQTPAEAAEASAAGWVPAMVVASPDDTAVGSVIAGRRVVLCPVTTGRAATCADCRLCARTSCIVAFPVHGSRRARARAAIRAAIG